MPEAKLSQTYVFFVREGVAGAARETKPSSWTAYALGTVTNYSNSTPNDPIVVDRPVDGRWVDYDVIVERDRQTGTLTISELSAELWKLVGRTNPTLSSGAADYTLGDSTQVKGWMQIQIRDQNGELQNTIEMFCYVEIETQDYGRGTVTATLSFRRLLSTLNSGSFANLTY